MKRPTFQDPYREILARFNRRGVRYVVVGMTGINYYAKNPAQTFATLDYDLFLEPSVGNVEKAAQALESLGWSLGTSGGPFKTAGLHGVVRDRRTIVATTAEGLVVELLLRVSGYPFSELARDAATFSIRGVPVRVGRLSKLLRSKRLAGRPKDRQFLERYKSLLEEP